MRKVFKNISEVVNKWVENSQDEGRAGNVSFEYGVLYSYGWCKIGKLYEDKKVALFTNDTYSCSTSARYIYAGEYVCRRKEWRTFRVADIEGNHEKNVRDYLAKMKETVLRFDRALWNGRWILTQNEELYNSLWAYCNIFEIKMPITLGLRMDRNAPYIKRRFYKRDEGGELFLPKWLAKKGMENVVAKDLHRTKNAEIRREIIKRIGIERICEELKAVIVDRQGDYQLLLLDLKDGWMCPFLRMRNPSIDVWHLEGVHPAVKTVQDALNYRRFGNDMFVRSADLDLDWPERQEYILHPERWIIKENCGVWNPKVLT